MARSAVRGTLSPTGPRRPAAARRLTRTLGVGFQRPGIASLRKPNSRVPKQPNSKAPWLRQPARRHHATVQPVVRGLATGAHPPKRMNSASLCFHPSRVVSSGAEKCLWLALRAAVLRLAISSLSALHSVRTPRLSSIGAARGAGAFQHMHPPLVAGTIGILCGTVSPVVA